MLHLCVIAPSEQSASVRTLLVDDPGATHITVLSGIAIQPAGDVVEADVTREAVVGVLAGLTALGLDHTGGIVLRRSDLIRSGPLALAIGFPIAMIVTAVASVLFSVLGLLSTATSRATRSTFIYSVGWFSLIVALLAVAAGMLALTSAKSASLVGVFISVTTVPAAGYAALAAVEGRWGQVGSSIGQLAVNLVGLVAAVLVLLVARRSSAGRPGFSGARAG